MASTVWRGYITFGLISIPVRLFRAARAERVSLRRVYREAPISTEEDEETAAKPVSRAAGKRFESRDDLTAAFQAQPATEAAPVPVRAPVVAPVQQVSVREGSNKVLNPQSVVKGYEYEKNRFVALEPEELKSLAPQTSAAMEIQEFVALAEIDPVYFETSYYVVPEEAGEKAYALLYRAFQASGLVALAQFAMHSREHVIVLRPGKTGILGHTMFFASEVRADEEYRADTSQVTKKELDLAQTLIHSLAGPFEPEKHRDTYRERLESLIANKVAGQPVTPPQRIAKPAEVVDIAEALRRSLANLKKPAGSAASLEKATPAVATPAKKTARRTKQK
jgi:DNA end-binding protein Ku